MKYLYGNFSDEQIYYQAKNMHSEIHRLLIYKDKNIVQKNFSSDEDFVSYFKNILMRYGGLNSLLGEPPGMILFMSTLQAALEECLDSDFDYSRFRKLIFDAHGYLTQMFGEVREDAKS